MKKILYFGSGIFFCIFVQGVYGFFTPYEEPIKPVYSSEALEKKDYKIILTKGNSMYPTLPNGESAIIEFNERKPEIGDIISFECLPNSACSKVYTPNIVNGEPLFIIHRLLSIAPDGCMEIRGDNVAIRDPNEPCYYPDKDIKILGVVKGLID